MGSPSKFVHFYLGNSRILRNIAIRFGRSFHPRIAAGAVRAIFTIAYRCQSVMALLLIMLATSADARIYYVHNDHLGTPIAMTDDQQHVVWRAEYEPFGKAAIDASSEVELNIRFPGQYFDKEPGLHYNYFRDYDPATKSTGQPLKD